MSPTGSGRGRLALVTGATGGLGATLVVSLLEAGWAVRAFADDPGRSSEAREGGVAAIDGVEWLQGDAADPERLARAAGGADVVFHLAERPGDGFDDPVAAHVANAEGTLAVLEAARAAQVRRVVYASSWQAAEPATPHAIQKLAGELYCGLYHRLHGLETVALRYPPGFSEGDAARATRRAADGEEGVGAVLTSENHRP